MMSRFVKAMTALSGLFLMVAWSTPKKVDLLVSRNTNSSVLRFDGKTGAFVSVFVSPGSGGVQNLAGMTYGPDDNLYIASFDSRNVLRFDGRTGAFIDDFVPPGSGGLGTPNDLIFGPDGNLYVSDGFFGTNSVLRYDGETGEFLDVFASGGGLVVPHHLEFGPDGNLYVESILSDSILRYDGETGAPLPAPGQPGAVFISGVDSVSMTFGPDGNLYAATLANEVLRFDGRTGAFIDVFVPLGSGGLTFAGDLLFGTDRNLYVTNFLNGEVLRFDGRTGSFLGAFVPAGSGGLERPIPLTFMLFDNDRDGVNDNDDECLLSDLRFKVDTGSGPTRIKNTVNSKGCSIQDRVNARARSAKNHGHYVRCIESLAKSMNSLTCSQREEMIDGAERSRIGY
ncbi:Vgb family protein [Archangium lansingense]|uniref:SMP-30/Gluconolactonase/LRE-like region domain-containing protein n=1 Tax=Archangium lansingense TaxID=2995310 RepID=A0ABT4A1Z3_9BACT|nr:hypothetical protein [Archangium lansinium]MCY1075611.1 hypothetical protein [Archangium lansinium]